MPELPVLLVQFEAPIPRKRLPAFRGAIIQHVGMGEENQRYHNHLSDEAYRYGYPLLQYKHFGGRPAILFIGEAVDDVAKLFKRGTRKLYLNGDPYLLRGAQTRSWLWELGLMDAMPTYVLQDWLPFSRANHERYQHLAGDTDAQRAHLERILRGNLLSMAKGLDWWVPGEIKVQIHGFRERHPTYVKQTPLCSFDLRFSCNLNLQRWCGLGRHVSLGHGPVVRRIAPRPAPEALSFSEQAAYEPAISNFTSNLSS